MFTFSVIYVVYFLFVVDFRIISGNNLYKGDQCSSDDGTQGICKAITSCQPAYESLKHGVFLENMCGFDGTTPMICCKETDPVTKPTLIATRAIAATTQHTLISTKTPKSPVTRSSRIPGEISQQKCKEYSQYAFKREQSPTSVRPPHGRTRRIAIPQISHILECGFDKLELLDGGLATTFEFPHMTLIGLQMKEKVIWGCGGSLISKNFILTAAQCLRHRGKEIAKFVRSGLTTLMDISNMQERTVSDIIVYPEYDEGNYHDIGLLKVSKSFDLNSYTRPACLQAEKTIPVSKAIASGWGTIGYADGHRNNELLKVVLEFFDTETCNETYKKAINAPGSNLRDGIIEDLMICAGSKTDSKDTCQGDAGGPLQVYHEGTDDIQCMYDIVGITSFGNVKCGLSNVPAVYTRVSAYIKWIEDTVWPQ